MTVSDDLPLGGYPSVVGLLAVCVVSQGCAASLYKAKDYPGEDKVPSLGKVGRVDQVSVCAVLGEQISMDSGYGTRIVRS